MKSRDEEDDEGAYDEDFHASEGEPDGSGAINGYSSDSDFEVLEETTARPAGTPPLGQQHAPTPSKSKPESESESESSEDDIDLSS